MASLVLLLSVLVRPHHIDTDGSINNSAFWATTTTRVPPPCSNFYSSCAATATGIPRKEIEEFMELEEKHLSECSRVFVDSVWP